MSFLYSLRDPDTQVEIEKRWYETERVDEKGKNLFVDAPGRGKPYMVLIDADCDQHPDEALKDADAGYIRVLEDLVDTLIDKDVIALTDLPQKAQEKHNARKSLEGVVRDG